MPIIFRRLPLPDHRYESQRFALRPVNYQPNPLLICLAPNETPHLIKLNNEFALLRFDYSQISGNLAVYLKTVGKGDIQQFALLRIFRGGFFGNFFPFGVGALNKSLVLRGLLGCHLNILLGKGLATMDK